MAITLKKLVIYNWHTIAEAGPLPMGQVCFLAGQNGSGKSTILDALSFLCLVQTRGFNRASDGNTSRGKERRTLLGYARGLKSLASSENTETGTKGRSKYCRPGATNTHVAAEFLSSKTGASFVIGASIELKDYSESDSFEPVWWGVPGAHLEELSFKVDTVKGQAMASLKEIKATLPQGLSLQENRTAISMRRMLSQKDYFNLTDNLRGDDKAFRKWAHSIQNAVSYEKDSITDLDSFIHKHVMPNEPVDVSEFQELLDRMNALTNELRQMNDQRDSLSTICSLADEYSANKKKAAVYDAAVDFARQSNLEERIELQLELCDRKEREVKNLYRQRDELAEQIRNVDSLMQALQSKLQDAAIQQLQYRIQANRGKISVLSTKQQDYQNSLRDAFRFGADANRLLGGLKVDAEVVSRLQGADVCGDSNDLMRLISALQSTADALRDMLYRLQQEKTERQSRLQDVERDIVSLASSLPAAPRAFHDVKAAIASAFAAEKVNDLPYFLCEMLEYHDDAYAKVVESFMGNDLFSIYVSPENYSIAVDAYQDFCLSNPEVYGVGLIDTSYYCGLAFDACAHSVASVLAPKNELIASYVNDHYGHVGIVADASIPEPQWEVCVDADGYCYSKHVFSRLKLNAFLTIGASARESHLNVCKQERAEITARLDAIADVAASCAQCVATYNASLLDFVVNGQDVLDCIRSIPRLTSELRKDEATLERLQDTDDQREYQRLSDMRVKLLLDQEKLNKTIADKDRDLGKEDGFCAAMQKDLAVLEDRMMELQKNDILLYDEAVAEVKQRQGASRRGLVRISEDLDSEKKALYKVMTDCNNTMVVLQKEYAHRTASDVPHGGIDVIATFRELLKKLNTTELPSTQQRLKLATDNTMQIYSETVLGQMHANFEAADKQRRLANNSLREFVFGGRRYEFDPIKAAPGQEAMFRMLTSPDNVGIQNDQISFESISFDDAFAETRAELFRQLASASEAEQSALLDYRNYCKFSMSVVSEDGSNRGNLADIVGLNSGSENQVPAYLIFAASLLSVYNRNRGVGRSLRDSDTVRFMLVDECFASMDEINCKKLVQMLSFDLGFQLVLAAPLDRYSTLAESIDTIWVMTDNKARLSRHCDYFTQTWFLRKLEELKDRANAEGECI